MDRKPTKRPRVARACDRCFSKKDKCDGNQPQCQICAKLGAECSYNRPQLRRGPQAGLRNKLEAQVEMLESVLGFLVLQVGDRHLSSLTNLLDLSDADASPLKDSEDEPAPKPGNIYPNSMTRAEASRVWNRSELASIVAPALGLELKSDNGETIKHTSTPAPSVGSSSSRNKASTSKMEPDNRFPPRLSPESGTAHRRQLSGMSFASSPQTSFASPMAPPPIASPVQSESMSRSTYLSAPEARGSPQRIWERSGLPSQSSYGGAHWASSPLGAAAAVSSSGSGLNSPRSRPRRPGMAFEDATNVSPELELEMDMLLDTYFQNFHTHAPFVDRHAILRWSSEASAQGRRRVTTHGPPESPGRLALILAICSLSASRHQSWQQSSRSEHARLQALSDDCHARARMLFFDAEGGSVFEVGPSHMSPGGRADGPGDIEAVQAILLLAIADIMQDRTTRAWVGLGMAIRLAQDVGIDKEPSRHDGNDGSSDTAMQDPTTTSVEQHRRLTWWTLFNFDVIFSLALGRTPALRAAESTTARPDPAQSSEEWNLCSAHVARDGSGRSSEGGLTRKVKARAISTFNAQSMLCEILSTVCTETDLHKLKDVMPALHQWRTDLPEHLSAAIVGSQEPAALGGLVPSTIPQPCHVWNLAMQYHFAFLVTERAIAVARGDGSMPVQSASEGMWSPTWAFSPGNDNRVTSGSGKEDWHKVTISSPMAEHALPRLLSRFVSAFGPLCLPPLAAFYILAAAHSLSKANDPKEAPKLWESLCTVVNTSSFAGPGIRRVLRLLPILGHSSSSLRAPHRSASSSGTPVGVGGSSPVARPGSQYNNHVAISPLEGMFMSPDPFAYDFGGGGSASSNNTLGRDADAALSYALGLHVGPLDTASQGKSAHTPSSTSYVVQGRMGSGSGPVSSSSPRQPPGSTPMRWPNERPSPASTTAEMAGSSLSEDGDASLARMYDVGISAVDHSNILYNLGLQPSLSRNDSLAGVFLDSAGEPSGVPSPWQLEATNGEAPGSGRPIQPSPHGAATPRFQPMHPHQQHQQQQQHSVPPHWHSGGPYGVPGGGNVPGHGGPNSLVPNGADPNAALGGLDLDLDLDFDVGDILDKWAHRGSEVL